MYAVFFATSRPNYAGWMTRYHLDLLNIDETHPGARAMLEAGLYPSEGSIRPKNEQTIL